jgi:membrane-associated protease RseP (regulator of RpoE activity)
MQSVYGGHPWITLYGLGGLASCNDCSRSPWRQIVISCAGPVAGFFFAAFVVSVLVALGRFQGFVLDWIPVRWDWFDPQSFMQTGHASLRDNLVFYLLYVNIMWGLVNLLPVYPLDGGQIARELFTLVNPRAGIIQSLQLSAGVAVLLTAYAILNQSLYIALLFGYLAYSSFQTLQAYRNHWR